MVTYLPFGYIMPDTIWQFRGIHYFKWTFPYLGLFAVLLVADTATAWRRGRGRLVPTGLLVGVPLLLASLDLEVDRHRLSASTSPGDMVALRMELPPGPVDSIDVSGLHGGGRSWGKSDFLVLVDGRPLGRFRDLVAFQSGGGTRLIFLRPLSGKTLEIRSGEGGPVAVRPLNLSAGTHRWVLAWPRMFRAPADGAIAAVYRLGEEIFFGVGGEGDLFAGDGWSFAEEWGRWSVDGRSGIRMILDRPTGRPMLLRIRARSFLRREHPSQRVEVLVNGRSVGRQEFVFSEAAADTVLSEFDVPAAMVGADGVVRITFESPDAISPRALGEGEDRRCLGVGLESLELVPADG
jgi:hypothetical protein